MCVQNYNKKRKKPCEKLKTANRSVPRLRFKSVVAGLPRSIAAPLFPKEEERDTLTLPVGGDDCLRAFWGEKSFDAEIKVSEF